MKSELPIKLAAPDWEVTTLGEICRSGGGGIQTGPFGSQLHADDYVDEGIPSIMPQDLLDGRIDVSSIARITPGDAKRLSRYRVREGDIVYSRRGDIRRRALIRDAQDGWLCGTGCLRVRVGKGARPQYICAYLGHPAVQEWIERHAVGATMLNLNTSILSSVPVALPSHDEQESIAGVLGMLDDKIDSNRRLAALLVQASAALFRARFVDFLGVEEFQDSEIGPIPRRWRVGPLYDVASVRYGAPFKSALFSENDGLPLLRIRDLGKDEPGVRTPEQRSDARLVQLGDIVVGMDGEFRAHLWHGPRSWLNQRVCVFDPVPDASRAFVFHAIKKPLAFFEATKQGTTVIHLGKRDIDTFRLVVPDAATMDDFMAQADPLLDKAVCLRSECRALTLLRDALLPRLISGALRVSETVDPDESAHLTAEEVLA